MLPANFDGDAIRWGDWFMFSNESNILSLSAFVLSSARFYLNPPAAPILGTLLSDLNLIVKLWSIFLAT